MDTSVTEQTASVKLNEEYCSRCSICSSLCPFEAIKKEPEADKIILEIEKCQVCGLCYATCPATAISSVYYDLDSLTAYLNRARQEYKSDTLAVMCKGSTPDFAGVEKLFGVSKFNILGPIEMEIILRGKETKWTVTGGFSRLFNNVELELIQPESGKSIHQEFLDQGREGLHHIRYDVEDLPVVLEKFEEEGIGILQEGRIVGLKYVYMDTESILGIIVEFSAVKKGRKRR